MISTLRFSMKACIFATVFLVGCGGSGPTGEIGTKEWCESFKKMSNDDAEKYAGTLNTDQTVQIGYCLSGMIK